MFRHIYVYRLKVLLRDRETLFWTLLFPIILSTFFYLGLAGISKADTFQAVPAAVVKDAAYEADEGLRLLLEGVSSGDEPLLNLQETDEETAERLLREGDIAAYIRAGNPPAMVAARSGFGQSLVQLLLNDYVQTTQAVTAILTENPAAAPELFEVVQDRTTFLERIPVSRNEADPLINYFYTLLAMACFYGSLLGMRVIRETQASHSQLAARIGAAPTHKMKAFLASAAATFTVQLAQMIILLLYLYFVLPIDFGDQTGFIILATLLGALAGLAYGCFIASLIKKSEGVTTAILISTTMLASFLSGMMWANMKYVIQKNVPLLSYLNPVNLLTDAYYSLNYFDSHDRYWTNMILLAAFTAVFLFLTYWFIRRRRYASI